ncbi:MAG: Na(+)/H(+) antiporter subunit B [Bradymonadia bacterium]
MKKNHMKMREIVVLRVVSRALIPFILLFGLYVQFHGDFGPGGGFQAGVIFAAALILYGLIFGLDAVQRVYTPFAVEMCMATGLILYAGTGFVSFMKNLNYLDYDVFGSHGQHYGILLIEAGVGITVASTMVMIFYSFAGRGRVTK